MYCNHLEPVLHIYGPKHDNMVARYGWLLRNINISNDNGSLTFYAYFSFFLSLPRLVVMSNMAGDKKQELLTLRERMSSPRDFISGSVFLIFLFFCFVLLCVFTYLVPSFDVRYEFRIKTMLDLSTSGCL